MSSKKMYFNLEGTGWSGSSAVLEYLGDFTDCYAMSTEIDICLREFGIFGMYLLLKQGHPLYGVIDRFNTYVHYVAPRINYMSHVCKTTLEEGLLRILEEFLNRICWRDTRAIYTYDLCFIDKILKNSIATPVFEGNSPKTKLKKKIFHWLTNDNDLTLKVECPMLRQPKETFRVCVNANEYKKAAKIFLREYANLFTNTDKFGVLNFFEFEHMCGKNLTELGSFFDELKIVFVSRDPRDQFTSWSKRGICSDERVDDFIRLSRERSWKNYPHNNSNILDIRFEDFVLRHEEISKKILDFLEIDAASKIANPKYDLELSRKNVGRWKTYPNQKVIEKIASELKDYIYE